jgi:hypothetical protein
MVIYKCRSYRHLDGQSLDEFVIELRTHFAQGGPAFALSVSISKDGNAGKHTFSAISRRQCNNYSVHMYNTHEILVIKVITKLPNSEQSYKGKVQTHNYINRQNQSTTGKL